MRRHLDSTNTDLRTMARHTRGLAKNQHKSDSASLPESPPTFDWFLSFSKARLRWRNRYHSSTETTGHREKPLPFIHRDDRPQRETATSFPQRFWLVPSRVRQASHPSHGAPLEPTRGRGFAVSEQRGPSWWRPNVLVHISQPRKPPPTLTPGA